jgi:hypothetical protein
VENGSRYIVSVSYAILIAVEESDGLPTTPFAAEEIRALAARLESIGFAKSRQTILTGAAASRSAIQSRLRKLATALSPDDTAWFVFAGPAFVEVDRVHLACADTLGDDRAATSLVLADLVKQLHATGATPRFLLDAPGLSDGEFAKLFPATGTAVALTASGEDEPSHAANGRRLWLQLVGDVLAGQVPDILDEGSLTAGALRDWAFKELARAIRKAISSPQPQTTGLFGPSDALLAHITPAKPSAAKLDLKKLKRICFRGEARDRVKNLAGFQKNFKLPEAATPSAQKWINRLAADNLKIIVEDTYNALREQLGFKRKDLESTIGAEGLAFIRTPSFDFTVSVSIDPGDPTSVIWRREVSRLTDADMLTNEGFREIFAGKLETLQFEFDKPIDVEALVDRIEADLPPGVSVRVASDGTSCDVTVKGFAGRVHVERKTLRVEGPPGLSPASLVEQFFAFQARFGGKKGLPALR